MPSHRTALTLLSLLVATGCGPTTMDQDGPDDSEAEVNDEAVSTAESALGSCYCAQPYTCGHSSSPSYMYSAAHAAMLRASVSDGALIQTFGDAPASVGTHCPEPGTRYSAATDVTIGSAPCSRVHHLRMEGFAAWLRVPPSFGYHIHAVYAGTPRLKSSLHNQLDSFAAGRNGLANNRIDTVCPITQAEKDVVARVRAGRPIGGTTTVCVPGGDYCGGDRVSGSSSTLYRCSGDGHSATALRTCAHGCSVNAGTNDSCRCSPGGAYCGGDVVSGSSSTLYRCGADGVSTSVIAQCARGCSVNAGTNDSCR